MPYLIIGALLIGLTLGVMGSGGSILTVPVLVYLLGHDGKVAIAESLAIVGGIALVTMFPYARSHLVNWRNVLFFGVPGMMGTYCGAWLSHYVPPAAQLTMFAVVMLVAGAFMLRKTKDADEVVASPPSQSFWLIGIEGLAVGIVTGMVGVGGGFLIVPALIAFGKLPMRVAVGTSLTLISLQSFSGFFKYLDVLAASGTSVDWTTVALFIAIGVIGSFAGHRVATQLNQQLLRRTFAVFLFVMGLFVLGQEGPKLVARTEPTRVSWEESFTDPQSLDKEQTP
ncbi:MAG: sulfite exporter TauE/SafE family protein [Planctomycetales bacterium]|nr:sulfite exporter TauE/SafE family protein [Planctomycetales bacterium]